MSIIIKGMDMPENCSSCPFCFGANNICPWVMEYATCKGRHKDCPLVPVQPHYDLIDHNALKIAVMDCDAGTRIDFLKHAMDCINKAPVVIPSDMPTYEAEEDE